ncbi:MAG: sigma-70 family RNA polymerase sigma factor [Caldilineaceae bacterium]|nr:sigma-70 family RNA polymerase sigma factor [Caldilineaceae bacterium]
MDNAILTLSTAPQLAPDEEAAIERTLAGDLNAFNQLVVKYQRLAYSVAYRMLQTEDAAADAVQDSFIKAYRALRSFKGGVFKSWLLRIVVNTCYDVLRAQKRYTFEPIGEEADEETPVALLVDNSESPQAYVERMELNGLIELGIRSLPADQRLVLTLCDVHGYAYEEIAEITGFPMGTVKSRISRARTKLRDFLLQQPELLPSSLRPKHR